MRLLIVGLIGLLGTGCELCFGQAVQPLPYSAQLKSDPSVGNIQGIQRYGRALKTDPDQGEGYSYHVYPVSDSAPPNPPVVVSMIGMPNNEYGSPQVGMNARAAAKNSDADQRFGALERQLENYRKRLETETDSGNVKEIQAQMKSIRTQLEAAGRNPADITASGSVADRESTSDVATIAQPNANYQTFAPQFSSPLAYVPAPYGPPPIAAPPAAFDWTAGIRSGPPVGASPYAQGGFYPHAAYPQWTGTPSNAYGTGPQMSMTPLGADIETKAIGVTRTGLVYTTPQIYHQPLIQIKLRVIEVARANGTSASSVLEYVSRANSNPSLTSGLPLNAGFENARGLTRFGVPDLVNNATTGTGMLVNLTGEHINWVASLLATEFEADIVTAPELVTLNGENVEFLAGEKVPFELGQNVIQGTNNNIQQVFYKHVGTLVSVTPRIVNWGLYGEGGGTAPFVNDDIADWNLLVQWVSDQLGHNSIKVGVGDSAIEYPLSIFKGVNAKPVPITVRTHLMMILGDHSKQDLIARGFPVNEICHEGTCAWSPNDCTIDLSVVVRLSDSSTTDINPDAPANLAASTKESNVRAVANVVQLKSGHGVVMAGLIGEREAKNTAKVPILGDLPIVGAAFRSRGTSRIKTEVLIFAEATVLPSDPNSARYESSRDYRLAAGYVAGEVLENPLECSLYRSGIGPKLGPCSEAEECFWRDHGRQVRSAQTQLKDILH